jgi:3-mercaptopyruvate sulfurtransferase SseA
VFTLSLLGYDRVRNYDGSMGEWANLDDTALTTE